MVTLNELLEKVDTTKVTNPTALIENLRRRFKPFLDVEFNPYILVRLLNVPSSEFDKDNPDQDAALSFLISNFLLVLAVDSMPDWLFNYFEHARQPSNEDNSFGNAIDSEVLVRDVSMYDQDEHPYGLRTDGIPKKGWKDSQIITLRLDPRRVNIPKTSYNIRTKIQAGQEVILQISTSQELGKLLMVLIQRKGEWVSVQDLAKALGLNMGEKGVSQKVATVLGQLNQATHDGTILPIEIDSLKPFAVQGIGLSGTTETTHYRIILKSGIKLKNE